MRYGLEPTPVPAPAGTSSTPLGWFYSQPDQESGLGSELCDVCAFSLDVSFLPGTMNMCGQGIAEIDFLKSVVGKEGISAGRKPYTCALGIRRPCTLAHSISIRRPCTHALGIRRP